MKKLLFIGLIFAVQTMFAQQYLPIKAKLVNTITNWSNSTSSATSYLAVTPKEALEAREVGLIFIATDSVQKTITVAGANSQFAAAIFSDSYTDSISSWDDTTVPTAAAPETKVVMLKDGTVNRLEACDRFKVTVSGGAAGAQGNDTGRTIKVYLFWLP